MNIQVKKGKAASEKTGALVATFFEGAKQFYIQGIPHLQERVDFFLVSVAQLQIINDVGQKIGPALLGQKRQKFF